MSNKCFKRVLEGTITDGFLPTFEKLTVRVSGAENTNMYLCGSGSTRVPGIEVSPGLSYANGADARTYDFTGTGNAYVPNRLLVGIYVTDEHFKVSLDDLILCHYLEIASLNPLYVDNFFNLKQLKNLEGSLTALVIKPSDLYGDIKDLPINLISADFRSCPNIFGNIEEIGNLLSLTQLRSLRDMPYVYGTFESMVAKYRTNGRTTGSITFESTWAWSTDITFNGNPIAGGSNKVLSWTATTITYDGVTIDA